MYQIFGMALFLLILSLPFALLALLIYLAFWLIETLHMMLLGLLDGSLATLVKRKKRRLMVGGTAFLLTAGVFLQLEFGTSPYAHLKLETARCSEEDILAEMPELELTEADIALLDAVLSAPEAEPAMEEDVEVIFPPGSAAAYTADYSEKPSDACEIRVYHDWLAMGESISFTGDSEEELFLYRWVYEEGRAAPDRISKRIRIYKAGSEKRYQDILFEYENIDGVLSKKVLTHNWFDWTKYYTILFTG